MQKMISLWVHVSPCPSHSFCNSSFFFLICSHTGNSHRPWGPRWLSPHLAAPPLPGRTEGAAGLHYYYTINWPMSCCILHLQLQCCTIADTVSTFQSIVPYFPGHHHYYRTKKVPYGSNSCHKIKTKKSTCTVESIFSAWVQANLAKVYSSNVKAKPTNKSIENQDRSGDRKTYSLPHSCGVTGLFRKNGGFVQNWKNVAY